MQSIVFAISVFEIFAKFIALFIFKNVILDKFGSSNYAYEFRFKIEPVVFLISPFFDVKNKYLEIA